MARAKSDQQFEAISREFDKLSMRASKLKAEIGRLQVDYTVPVEFDQDMVTQASALFRKIEELAAEGDDYSTARSLFDALNMRLFFKFRVVKEQPKRKTEIAGGIATFGNAPPPVALHKGPTGRRGASGTPETSDHPRPPTVGEASLLGDQVRKDDVLANCSRGDRI